jgi:pimeloyl-ACP methyl ester carboxylesterase
VDTDAEWFASAESALSPHFEVRAFRYNSFRRLGKLRVVLDPWPLGFGLILSLLPNWRSFGLALTIATEALALSAIPVSIWLAGRNRKRVVDRYLDHLEKITVGERPHLIAHSFGTYIGAEALQHHPHRSYSKMILDGCILPVDFDWKKCHDRGHNGLFREVRNEVSKNDELGPILRGAKHVGLAKVFGEAGTKGFTLSPYVHAQQSLWHNCNRCKTPPRALVHNVQVDLHHSKMLGLSFMESSWLPFLWAIHPSEYRDFLEFCDKLGRETSRDAVEFRNARDEFLRRQWGWLATPRGASRRTLPGAIEAQITARVSPGVFPRNTLEMLTAIAAEQTWKTVAKARSSISGSPNRRHLDPRYAAYEAARRVVALHRRKQKTFKAS